MVTSATSPGRPLRVLVVDDNRLFVETLVATLELTPQLDVVGAAFDGLEALDRAERLRPDVVLMDVAMPGLDGVEATHRLRRRLPHVQVVMLSASTAPEDVWRARAAGAGAYLFKGCRCDDVLAAVVEVCGRGRLRSPLSAAAAPAPAA